ncbi:MAG TPA: hypothetical protein VIH99_12125 [Bdellovibrionota bacterium]|jgi:hypothetical protein
MKNLFLYGFLFLMSYSASAATLPASWYVLPESGSSLSAGIDQDDAKKEAELAAQLDAIFGAQAAALDGHVSATDASAGLSGQVPWRFVSFIGDLGVTANGKVGALAWKGTPAMSVYWQKKENFGLSPAASEEGTTAAMVLSAETTQASVDSEIDSLVKAAMASHKISNEEELKKNMRSAVADFASLGAQVDKAPTVSWDPSRLRVDLNVEVSGKVSFLYSASAALRVRLEWYKVPGKKPAFSPLAAEGKWLNSKGLESLMVALSQDVATVADSQSPGVDLVAKQFRVGLGVSVSGTIGVAKGTASALAYIYFSRVEKKPTASVAVDDSLPLYMVDADPSEQRLQFAQAHGNLVAGGGKEAIYRLDRAKFRAGMTKAMSMGRFFAQRARKQETAKWKLKTVKGNFDLSITGSVGVVTVGGLASAEIEFENKNF